MNCLSQTETHLPGRRSLEVETLRTHRIDIDVNRKELEQILLQAGQAAMPVRRWARKRLLSQPIRAAYPLHLRELWGQSSTLQSNFNQIVQRVNELREQEELTEANASPLLVALMASLSPLHELVRVMRVEMLAMSARK